MRTGSRTVKGLVALVAGLVLALPALDAQPERKQKKPSKNDQKEPVTQTLPVLPDPPAAVAAETARLVFHVSALSSKGLLSQQSRDALKSLERDNRGAQIVKLRAFVAGTGDMRRVQQIVSEVFSEKKQPLPALTTVQVGALPLEGAQVVIESVSEDKRVDKRAANPGGLAFLPAQPVEALKAAGEFLRVTCFLNSLEGLAQVRSQVAAAFPAAAANFVQLTRFGGTASSEGGANCEGVARAPSAHAGGVVFTGPKIIFSGLQMAFQDQEADVRLAFDRLKKAVEPLGGRMEGAFVSVYPLTRAAAEAANRERATLGAGGPTLLFEGLPALDATVGVDVVAAKVD
ncbi:MAG TPA: Rid family hydrolase [Bryobacteraceae bacterium]|nr:Rid family hydrolase [Bryobacteraceae bacterium]